MVTSIAEKAAHVGREAARNTTFDHHCHWPGCTLAVPPAMWGCKHHWFSIPKSLRDEIWRTYSPGQELTKDPSPEYVAAAKAVRDWIYSRQAPAQRELRL